MMAGRKSDKKNKRTPHSRPVIPLGRKIEIRDEFFPAGCRGILMMRIVEEKLDLKAARMLIPEIEEGTHKVLMKMASGEISGGMEQSKPYVIKAVTDKKRQVISLREQGLTHQQIADALGMSLGGVANYLTYG